MVMMVLGGDDSDGWFISIMVTVLTIMMVHQGGGG